MKSSENKLGQYAIVTPAYNEEANIRCTIESVLKQTILPVKWVIVDDDSTDNTVDIIKEYLNKYSFIELIHNTKGKWPFGTHAVKNFYLGYDTIKELEFDYIVKLDGDLDIDRSDFFEVQLKRMSDNDKLGICSGLTYSTHTGNKVLTKDRPYWHTGGAMKFYRRACLEDFNGLDAIYGWDGIDEYKAMCRGWKTRTFYDLHVNHLGKIRALDREKKNWLSEMQGESFFKRGYPFEFVLLRYLKLYIKGKKDIASSFWKGYFSANRSKVVQVVSRKERSFVRKFQYLRIMDSLIPGSKML